MRFLICIILLLASCAALDNGLGRTPQMAWNSWNALGCHINETIIKQIAEALVTNGLRTAGYEYVNLDDCWALSRNASGFVVPDPVAFPSGIKALADYIHSLGLKFGLYSDSGLLTCAGRPGSLGYETQDAEQYAAWGVDYLKYDNCDNQGLPDPPRYAAMRDALNKTGRPIFFSLCDWTITTAAWGVYTGNSWRTTTDISPYFDSWTNNLDQNGVDAAFAAPGGWNDPDMLEVGNGELTHDQDIAHFSLWALVKAPLVLGNDLRTLSQEVLDVITNSEVISINQDSLGIQGRHLTYMRALDNSTTGNIIFAGSCTGGLSQQFDYIDGTIVSRLTGECLSQFVNVWGCDGAGASIGGALYLQECGVLCKGSLQKFDLSKNILQTNFTEGTTPLCVQSIPKTNSQASDVRMWNCSYDIAQVWTYNNGYIQNAWKQCLTVSSGAEVWAGELNGGSYVVALFNRATLPQNVSVWWQEDIGFSSAATVRDLWAHKDLGTFFPSFTATVNPQGAVFLKVTPV